MMKSLGDILKSKGRQSPFMRGVLSAGAVDVANIFIESQWGEEGKKLAKAVYIKEGNLVIACLSSVMAQEMKFKEADLIAKINAQFGKNMVKKVRYLS